MDKPKPKSKPKYRYVNNVYLEPIYPREAIFE